jgi:hypothetical protein
MTGQEQPIQRVCGRCRRTLEDDPTLVFQTDWALCPTCTGVLLPPKPHTEPAPSATRR